MQPENKPQRSVRICEDLGGNLELYLHVLPKLRARFRRMLGSNRCAGADWAFFWTIPRAT